MPTYTLDELIKMNEPQAQRDKALISRCVDGLGLYAAQIAAEDRFSSKILEMRNLAETLVSYWGLDDDSLTKNAKPRDEYLQAFDERVDEARTGGAVAGDAFQSAPNVIYGLYRYGDDMAGSMGSEAMKEILSMSGLMKEIAKAWDFEPGVLDDLTTRLENKVRGLLEQTPLPGRPVSGVQNVGYTITQAVLFDNNRGFALAHRHTASAPYVTWQFTEENGVRDYYWGKYTGTEESALIDYFARATEYKGRYGVKEKTAPSAEVDAVISSATTPSENVAESYDVIEIFGRESLFSNGRIDRNTLPDGVYCYDIRDDGNGNAGSLEAVVRANHYATIISMTDFGLNEKDSYIPLDYDTEPNFIGEVATIEEYMASWVEPNIPMPEVIQPEPWEVPTLLKNTAENAAANDPGEKTSVLNAIREAQKAPKPPARPQDKDRKKQGPEHE